MTQLDMVLVKYYFTQQEAGYYAAASILGKAVLFLPGGIVMALYPMVAENHARGQTSAHLLAQALGLTVSLCVFGAAFYWFFGEGVVILLYGASYQESGPLLKYFGLAILPMAVVLVVVHFLIAKGRVIFAYLFLPVAPLQMAAIHWFHDSLFSIITVIGVSGMATMCIGVGFLWREFQDTK